MEKLVLRVPEWQGELVFSRETLIFVGVILLMIVGVLFCFWGYKFFRTILFMGIGIVTCYGSYLLVEPMTANDVIRMFLTVSLTFLGVCFVYFLSIIWGFILDKLRIRTALAKRTYLLAAPVGAAMIGLTIYYMIWRDEIVAGVTAAVCLAVGLTFQHFKRKKQVRFRSYDDLIRLSRPQFDVDEEEPVAVAAGMAAVVMSESEKAEPVSPDTEVEPECVVPEAIESEPERDISEAVEPGPEYDMPESGVLESVKLKYDMPELVRSESWADESESVESESECDTLEIAEPESIVTEAPEPEYVSSSVYASERVRAAVYESESKYTGSSVYEPEPVSSAVYESELEGAGLSACEPEPEYTESAVYQTGPEDVWLEAVEPEPVQIQTEPAKPEVDGVEDSRSFAPASDRYKAVQHHSGRAAAMGRYDRKRRSAKDTSLRKLAGGAAFVAVGLGSFLVGRISKGGED